MPKVREYRHYVRSHGLLATVMTMTSFKGGVAKTTSVELLALERAKRDGDPVLLLDMDPQVNLTNDLKHRSDILPGSVANVLVPRGRLDGSEWEPEQVLDHVVGIKYEGMGTPLHLLPGSPYLVGTLSMLDQDRNLDPNVPFRLRAALDIMRPYYQYIMLDTGPGISSLAGDLAYYASDVLLVPIDGLRACRGLVSVLRRVWAQHDTRMTKGFGPLHVVIFCPHFIGDRTADPYGPEGVHNQDWYPLMCEWFPQRFIRGVVDHSTALPRAVKAHNPLSGLRGKQRRQFRDLHDAVFHHVHNRSQLETLADQIDDGRLDLDKLESDVDGLIRETENRVSLRRVRYMDGRHPASMSADNGTDSGDNSVPMDRLSLPAEAGA